MVREHRLAPWLAVATVCFGAFMGQLGARGADPGNPLAVAQPELPSEQPKARGPAMTNMVGPVGFEPTLSRT